MNKSILTKSKKGFTLLEVISVIAMLSILASVAIPAYSGYMESTRQHNDFLIGENLIESASIAALTIDHDIPENMFVELIWSTRSGHSGQKYYGSVIIRNPGPRLSVFNEPGSTYDMEPFNGTSSDYNKLTEAIVESLNGDPDKIYDWSTAVSHEKGAYGFIGFGESAVSKQTNLSFHLNMSTGEVALARPDKFSAGSEVVNDWYDIIGLDIIPAPK